MSCPTCGHTMDHIGQQDEHCRIFHCIRCGTMRLHWPSLKKTTDYTPVLVGRCRQYEREFDKENIAQFYRNTWNRLGIAESIHPPEDRK